VEPTWRQPTRAIVTPLGRVSSAALLIAAVYGLALIIAGFLAPAYESTSVSSSGETTHGSGTLIGVNGLSAAVVLGAPLLLTLVVGYALWRPSRPSAVPFAWTLTGLLAGFNLLAMASIGVFLLPLTADVIVACAMCRSRSKPPVTAPHPAAAG
jgi:multisubunit Na+/H+ antiporter MnhB subunit